MSSPGDPPVVDVPSALPLGLLFNERNDMAAVGLTEREKEIGRWIWAGLKNRQIAAKLGISIKTVEAHRAKMMAKCRTSNTAQLLKALFQMGVIQHGG